MPPAVGNAIAGVASALGAVGGAKIQSNAAKRASDVQAQYADRALAREEQLYQQARDDYNRWLTGGDMRRLSDLLGVAPPDVDDPTRRATVYRNPDGTLNSGGQVQLRAPNGQTRYVPADLVQHYVSRGAAVLR